MLLTTCVQDALDAMKALGLNPGEQEMIDMTNEVAVNGLVYFPDFCKIVLRKYREDSNDLLNTALFKVTIQFSWFLVFLHSTLVASLNQVYVVQVEQQLS